MVNNTASARGAAALSGVRVLEISRALAGPWCAQNLGDLGAEIIKVERPQQGDESRAWGPPWLKDAAGADTAESSYFAACNRNKKSVVVDLSTPGGQQDIRRLAAGCDVLIENYKVGQLKQYALDYPSLRQINPSLIYCSITGFGQTGPWARRGGYDLVGQAMSGFMSITGERDGFPGAGPQKAGIAIADLLTGMYATVAVLAALYHRARTGEGQYIDIGLLDCMLAAMANVNTSFLASGSVPQRQGNAHQSVVPYGLFEAADGHLVLAIANDPQFQKFCAAAGQAALAEDPRFRTNTARVEQRSVLLPLIEEIVRQRPRDDWMSSLEAAGVPCAPIYDVREALNNPQVLARGLRIELPHGSGAMAHLVGSPMNFSATPVSYRLAPPILGEHDEELLGR